jgi:hypothetical protein
MMLSRLWMILSIIICSCTSVNAQTQYETLLTNGTRIVVANLKELVKPTLSSDEVDLIDSITFRVPSEMAFQGLARIRNGKREIVVYPGLALMYNVIAEDIYVGTQGMAQCTVQHMQSSITAFLHNLDPATSVSDRWPVFEMNGYAPTDASCKDADKIINGAPIEGQQLIANMTQTSLALVVLHEIAHHILGHVTRDQALSPEESQAREEAADQWALEHFTSMEMATFLALPYLVTSSVLTETTIERQKMSTHPKGSERALKAIEAMKNQLASSGAKPSTFQYLDDIGNIIKQYFP